MTDGTFTDCDGDGDTNVDDEEWSDVTPTVQDDGVVYADQADLIINALIPDFEQGLVDDADFFVSDGTGLVADLDHLMLMYESNRTTPLGPNEYVLIHFMTVDDDVTKLLHYAVRVYSDQTIQVFIDGVDQGPGRFEQIDILNWVVDDFDGTVVWYDITKREGRGTNRQELTVDQIRRLIREAGCVPVERDTLYHEIHREQE